MSPLVGRTMDRRASARRRKYDAETYCERHRQRLENCTPMQRQYECMVCGCGGLCDGALPCPMQTRPVLR